MGRQSKHYQEPRCECCVLSSASPNTELLRALSVASITTVTDGPPQHCASDNCVRSLALLGCLGPRGEASQAGRGGSSKQDTRQQGVGVLS